jgi:hypothetical protein
MMLNGEDVSACPCGRKLENVPQEWEAIAAVFGFKKEMPVQVMPAQVTFVRPQCTPEPFPKLEMEPKLELST